MIPAFKTVSSLTPHTSSLNKLFDTQLGAVNASILEKMKSPVPLIAEVAGYLISLGGKRLRPLLTLATAELCGYTGPRHIQLAACVEFIHTATLLHDDVVDQSRLRRGKDTANALWNNKTSVLVGDFLFSRAFELMVCDGSLEILKVLSQASSAIAEGEVLQLSSSYDLNLSEDVYFQIIHSKTARLFSAAAEVGAIVAGASPKKREACAQFGQSLGMAFQLLDDVLDYAADQETLGKGIGDDFREGKITLPVILAYQQGSDRTFWEEAFHNNVRDRSALTHAIHLLRESGALIQTKNHAKTFIDKALACLDAFPDSPLKRALQDLTYYSLYRDN